MEERNIISYRSSIDSSYVVTIVYEGCEVYPSFRSILDHLGDTIAILDLENKKIYIDGESLDNLGIDHILCIESHEICHHVLGHQPGIFEEDEIEADISAIYLLQELGYSKSAEMLIRRLKDNNNIDYYKNCIDKFINKERLKKFKKYLKKKFFLP